MIYREQHGYSEVHINLRENPLVLLEIFIDIVSFIFIFGFIYIIAKNKQTAIKIAEIGQTICSRNNSQKSGWHMIKTLGVHLFIIFLITCEFYGFVLPAFGVSFQSSSTGNFTEFCGFELSLVRVNNILNQSSCLVKTVSGIGHPFSILLSLFVEAYLSIAALTIREASIGFMEVLESEESTNLVNLFLITVELNLINI